MFVLCAVLPAMGMQGLVAAPRPALLAPSILSRCAPPLANEGDARVDFDFESGDECVISEAGTTCLEADVAGPLRIDDIDGERRGRSSHNEQSRRRAPVDFDKLSNEDFKKAWGSETWGSDSAQVPPAEAPGRQEVPSRKPPRRTNRPAFGSFSSPEDMREPWSW